VTAVTTLFNQKKKKKEVQEEVLVPQEKRPLVQEELADHLASLEQQARPKNIFLCADCIGFLTELICHHCVKRAKGKPNK